MAEWQTHYLQEVASLLMWVQVPPTAPLIGNMIVSAIMSEQMQTDFKHWQVGGLFPTSIGTFDLQVELTDTEDAFHLFSYVDKERGWAVQAIYDKGIEEFSLKGSLCIMQITFIEFISADFDFFRTMLMQKLVDLVDYWAVHPEKNFSVLLKKKKIDSWEYEGILPDNYAGFQRIISPDKSIKILNGSFVIAAYYNVACNSGLVLLYNILRDDFFAEIRVHHFPSLVHDFDSHDLRLFERNLKSNLKPLLESLKEKASTG